MFNQGYYYALATLGLCKSGEALPDILNKTKGAVKKMVTRFKPKAVPDVLPVLKNEATPPSIRRAAHPVKLKPIPPEFSTPPKRVIDPTVRARPAVSPVAATAPSVAAPGPPPTAASTAAIPEIQKGLLADPQARAGLLGAGVGAGLMGGGALLGHSLGD
jgi:hypothetical protein